MRSSLALLAALAVPCAAAVPASGCSNQAGPADASTDATYLLPGPDGATEDAESDGSTSLSGTMRLANMSPDLGPVDFCWRVAGASTFTGPVIMGSLDAGTALPDVACPATTQCTAVTGKGAIVTFDPVVGSAKPKPVKRAKR